MCQAGHLSLNFLKDFIRGDHRSWDFVGRCFITGSQFLREKLFQCVLIILAFSMMYFQIICLFYTSDQIHYYKFVHMLYVSKFLKFIISLHVNLRSVVRFFFSLLILEIHVFTSFYHLALLLFVI